MKRFNKKQIDILKDYGHTSEELTKKIFTMKNIHKAATDWFELKLSAKERLKYFGKYDSYTGKGIVDHIWLHEIVLPWYYAKSGEYKSSINWPQVMRECTDEHCIAVLYLKEHEGNINLSPEEIERIAQPGGSLTFESEMTVDQIRAQFGEEAAEKAQAVLNSATPISTEETGEQADAIQSLLDDVLNSNHTPEFIGGKTQGLHLGYEAGRVEGNDFIQSLLDALINMHGYYHSPIVKLKLKGWMDEDRERIKAQTYMVINKTKSYLGTK